MKKMGLEECFTLTRVNILEIFKTGKDRVKECSHMWIKIFILVTGKMEKSMELELMFTMTLKVE